MSNTPTLETERLILRKFTENDLEALYQIYRDPDVNRFLPWFPLQSMDEARKFFEDRYASLYAEPQAYAYAICLKRGNRPIGYVKVDMAEPTISAMACARNSGIRESPPRPEGPSPHK